MECLSAESKGRRFYSWGEFDFFCPTLMERRQKLFLYSFIITIYYSCPGLLQLLQSRKLMMDHKMKIIYCFGASPLALNSDFALAPPFPPFD